MATQTFDVVVVAGPASVHPTTSQAVLAADQIAAAVGQVVSQVPALGAFAGSYVPVGQQLASLITLGQQDASTLQTYPAFDQGVTTFLNAALAGSQPLSPLFNPREVSCRPQPWSLCLRRRGARGG